MKAILVMDLPKYCYECELYPCNYDYDDCPLKPMPQREEIHEKIYQAYGLGKEEPYERMRDAVDKVLDEILG